MCLAEIIPTQHTLYPSFQAAFSPHFFPHWWPQCNIFFRASSTRARRVGRNGTPQRMVNGSELRHQGEPSRDPTRVDGGEGFDQCAILWKNLFFSVPVVSYYRQHFCTEMPPSTMEFIHCDLVLIGVAKLPLKAISNETRIIFPKKHTRSHTVLDAKKTLEPSKDPRQWSRKSESSSQCIFGFIISNWPIVEYQAPHPPHTHLPHTASHPSVTLHRSNGHSLPPQTHAERLFATHLVFHKLLLMSSPLHRNSEHHLTQIAIFLSLPDSKIMWQYS